MNVQLRPDLERFVEEKVKAGEYASTAQVVEAGIARLMRDTTSHVDRNRPEFRRSNVPTVYPGASSSWEELLSKYF
jgi:Arc/MetJ-type ribon-helix-helix transcriptional regulator